MSLKVFSNCLEFIIYISQSLRHTTATFRRQIKYYLSKRFELIMKIIVLYSLALMMPTTCSEENEKCNEQIYSSWNLKPQIHIAFVVELLFKPRSSKVVPYGVVLPPKALTYVLQSVFAISGAISIYQLAFTIFDFAGRVMVNHRPSLTPGLSLPVHAFFRLIGAERLHSKSLNMHT